MTQMKLIRLMGIAGLAAILTACGSTTDPVRSGDTAPKPSQTLPQPKANFVTQWKEVTTPGNVDDIWMATLKTDGQCYLYVVSNAGNAPGTLGPHVACP